MRGGRAVEYGGALVRRDVCFQRPIRRNLVAVSIEGSVILVTQIVGVKS